MTEAFDLKSVDALVKVLEAALIEEFQGWRAVNDTEASLNDLKALIVGEAEREGKIDGKNVDTRKVQREAVVAENEAITQLTGSLDSLRTAARMAEIKRQSIEAKISLTRAWLYSQRQTE